MERFKIDGHGQRFAFWTDEARSLLQGTLQPIYRMPRKRAITEEIPVHMQAVFDRTAEEKRLVDYIVQSPGAEQHLVDVLNGKTSKWYPPKSFRQVPVYLDSEEPQDNLCAFLKCVLYKTPTKLSFTDEVQLICDVLFPEAIIYGLAGLQNLDAEQAFLSGPHYHRSEVEEFNRIIDKQLRKEGRASSWSQ
ncbi:PWWP domain-containing DNA repair factor 3B [Misgurnus anguillicaudatus]|uniref:PWWP domain-containing DNA repair factor 3B n=1 Tax=Misgurnus anguillicaudatus TaxID=75329 RepID=UPI003CCF0CB5